MLRLTAKKSSSVPKHLLLIVSKFLPLKASRWNLKKTVTRFDRSESKRTRPEDTEQPRAN